MTACSAGVAGEGLALARDSGSADGMEQDMHVREGRRSSLLSPDEFEHAHERAATARPGLVRPY